VQERLTKEIANAVWAAVEPAGVGVVVEAAHMCMVMRGALTLETCRSSHVYNYMIFYIIIGVQKTTSKTVTSCMLGEFRDNPMTRSEFLTLLGR
jgi:GTP cyclohydrolase I